MLLLRLELLRLLLRLRRPSLLWTRCLELAVDILESLSRTCQICLRFPFRSLGVLESFFGLHLLFGGVASILLNPHKLSLGHRLVRERYANVSLWERAGDEIIQERLGRGAPE